MNQTKPRLRAVGDAAEAVGAYVLEHLPQAELVADAEPADLIVMRPEDLDEMLEDAAATATWERTRGQEAVPIAVVDRLLAGDNPIRVWREHRGLSLSALAEAAGIGKGYLSQLETGGRQGPVATLKQLALALRVELDDLV